MTLATERPAREPSPVPASEPESEPVPGPNRGPRRPRGGPYPRGRHTMKRSGILNAELRRVLATLGHTDSCSSWTRASPCRATPTDRPRLAENLPTCGPCSA
ncbi:hypothetical protein GCM10023238_32500 [Streptomyces heliomycini]